jgi:hypothetical protein
MIIDYMIKKMNIYSFLLLDIIYSPVFQRETQTANMKTETDVLRAKLAAENAKPEADRDLGLIRELTALLLGMTRQPANMGAGTVATRRPANMGAGTVATRRPAMSDHTMWLVRVALEWNTAHLVRRAKDAIHSEPEIVRDFDVLRQLG